MRRTLFIPMITMLLVCLGARADEADTSMTESKLVYVSIIDKEGKVTDPVLTPMVVRTDEEWRGRLTPEQYRITRNQGTEPAFCGGLLKNKEEGIYLCIGCDLPLFESNAKFESGTGWPSFYQPVGWTNIAEKIDFGHGMVRTEILCARCEGHLGHLFEDGPRPTGLRYCLNSESLRFLPTGELAKVGEAIPERKVQQAVFASGPKWEIEGDFEALPGVMDVTNGFATGSEDAKSPAVLVIYDPDQTDLETLLKAYAESEAEVERVMYGEMDTESKQAGAHSIAVQSLRDFQRAPLRSQNLTQRYSRRLR